MLSLNIPYQSDGKFRRSGIPGLGAQRQEDGARESRRVSQGISPQSLFILLLTLLLLAGCSSPRVDYPNVASARYPQTFGWSNRLGQSPVLDPQHRTQRLSAIEREGLAKAANGTAYKVGKPYKIKGRVYRPREDDHYSERGIASWYGPNFHGKATANGGIFNQNLLSAAHRTLPIPSVVRVTNLENGRNAVIKVIDRGPFAHDRIIDISRRGAEHLGFRKNGTALVRVEIVHEASKQLREALRNKVRPPDLAALIDKQPQFLSSTGFSAPIPNLPKPTQSAPTPNQGNYFVQIGSFVRPAAATLISEQMMARRFAPIRVVGAIVDGRHMYRVQVGPFSVREQAVDAARRIQRAGFDGIFITNQT